MGIIVHQDVVYRGMSKLKKHSVADFLTLFSFDILISTGNSQAATESTQNNSSDSQNTNASPNAGASTNPNACANDLDEDGEEPPEERPIQLKRAHEEEQVMIYVTEGSRK